MGGEGINVAPMTTASMGLLVRLPIMFAAAAAVFLLPLSPGAETLDELVARTLAAYGGSALPEQEKVIRLTGRTWSHRQQAEGATLRELRWPDYLRVEIAYEDGVTESRVMVGDDGWRDGEPAPAPLTLAMKLQAARTALPMILDWEGDGLTDIGETTREDGTEVRHVVIDLGEGLALFVEIDRGSARILRSAGVMQMGGMEMDFGAVYSDFRDFGDISWPAREDQSAMGQQTGWTIVDEVETGLTLDPTSLRP